MTPAATTHRPATAMSSRAAMTMTGYLSALVLAEVLFREAGFLIGGLAHLALLVVLLVHHAGGGSAPYGPFLLAMTLPSLIRIVSLTVTVAELPAVFWLAAIGVPVALAAILVLRMVPVALGPLFARPSNPVLQVGTAIGGVVHGLVVYLVLGPEVRFPGSDIGTGLVTIVALLLFAVVLEEVVFRGILLRVTLAVSGSRVVAVLVAAALFGSMFISSDSLLTPLVMATLGVILGASVVATQSLWGVLGARALMTLGLLLVWPAVLP